MIRILYLYPDLMNLYGDYGNIAVLERHLNDQGLKVDIDRANPGDDIDFDRYDFIYMGSGTERNQKIALNDLYRYKNDLKIYIEEERPLLFTGNAMELLGKKINDQDGLGIIDFSVEEKEKRYTGDVIVRNDEIGEAVGFINKSSIISGGEKMGLFRYVFTDSNLIDNSYEGYRYKNAFGTHIIGPILAKNPSFMELIVKLLIGDKGYRRVRYEYEEESYNVTLKALKERGNIS